MSAVGKVFALILIAAGGMQTASAGPRANGNQDCLKCHSQLQSKLAFADGKTRELRLDEQAWAGSVHGRALLCVECHQKIDIRKHPRRNAGRGYESDRAYLAELSESCERCHYAYYTRVQDSIHAQLRKTGTSTAPVCADCHSVHTMTSPAAPRKEINRKCGGCHGEIYSKYQNSVHGKALELEVNNGDVPVCTDCHNAHSIADPRTKQFHAISHTICAKCHEDKEKMARHNLNPSVPRIYLESFHGRSNQIYKDSAVPQQVLATCTDCHGVHDVMSFRRGASDAGRAQVRQRIEATCRRCHSEATPRFTDAWLSHYEVSEEKTPMIWKAKRGFYFLNAFLIGFFVLNVLIALWRAANRGKWKHHR